MRMNVYVWGKGQCACLNALRGILVLTIAIRILCKCNSQSGRVSMYYTYESKVRHQNGGGQKLVVKYSRRECATGGYVVVENGFIKSACCVFLK